ncbi:hypothetical protein Palpr_1010 [Paludibacter propionicigenes WB4]|uniref:Uncharacterized protein n=1 Tax=Paludibacter propionicigenes (strain DSM 17365 / JCM 13257 / WB4) TaxID=694427 RepID=E4T365_PALPW|nr:hypothetical protein [Paludibacter propionicigenes]ADQ79159.1 hypothetical protein Palpr_1010 [Paludibacter propionicigenes WB4]
MKKVVSTIFIVLGLYLVMYSGRTLWKVWLDEQDIAAEKVSMADFLKIKHEKEKPNTAFDMKYDLKKYVTTCQTAKARHSIFLTIGLALLVAGLTILVHSNRTQLTMWLTKKEYLQYGFAAIVLHSLYWFMIGLLYFSLQMLVKKEVSGCVVDSMFLFYVSGLSGFYIAYFYLTDKFLKPGKLFKWFIGCLLSIFIGFFLAYMLPYLSWLIRTPHSLSNISFYIGFLYMAFFVVANVVIGTIFKGFFNWIKIAFGLHNVTNAEAPSVA